MKPRAGSSSTMMRIAIAGGGGFAYLLAQEIAQSANAVLVLTRNVDARSVLARETCWLTGWQLHPEFEEDFPGCQVAVVDFGNVEELRYTLQGVDLLISTISNSEQLNLIDAARRARVRLFVPSEFEGAVSQRPSNDPLDRGSQAALDLLQRWAQSKSHTMPYTVFSCGIFMERFGPGGLQAYNMGAGSGLQSPDDYLVNIENATAEIVETNSQGRPAQVTLTSAYDVARFVAAAIEMGPGSWPQEFRMRGDQMSVRDLVGACSDVRGVPVSLATHSYQDAVAQAQFCSEIEDYNRYYYFQRLIQTANGRYHFRQANLNEAVNQHDGVEVRPLRFRQWLEQVWGPAV